MSLIEARYGADVAAWLPGNALSFDTETTGVDTSRDRIVTATVLEVGPDGAADRGNWLLNPGVTTDKAVAEGANPEDALLEIRAALLKGWAQGLPLIVMNAGFDLTLLAWELDRYHLPAFELGPVLDPLAIDRLCVPDRYRKRNLQALASHYDVKQTDAHNARGDALTAARVVWKQARRFKETFALSLAEMQQRQADAHRQWAEDFEGFLRRKGKTETIEREWPIRRGAA